MNEITKNKIYYISKLCFDLGVFTTFILLIIFIIYILKDAGTESKEIRDATKSLSISVGASFVFTTISFYVNNKHEPKK